jgi:hypothetical protein
MAARLGLVASILLLLSSGASASDGMKTEIRSLAGGMRVLELSGAIALSDRERVPRVIRAGGYDEVWLDSPGGNVAAGLAIGRAMRVAGVVARVPRGAMCASACVYLLTGAPIRFADEPFSIGVHPASISNSERAREIVTEAVTEGGDQGSREIMMILERNGSASGAEQALYYLEMGVSPKLVEHLSEIQFNCMRFLSRNGARYFNVINTDGAPPSNYRPTDSRERGSGC